jgi:hypothetical protein
MPIEMLSGFTANISMETQIQQNRRYTTIQLDIIHTGDCLEILKTLPEDSVHCCVTSPPYYALRDYGMDAQIGRETTPKEYISRLTEVFTEVRRVLRPDGTLWLNISDTYAGKGNQGDFVDPKNPNGRNGQAVALNNKVEGCKPKDMIRFAISAMSGRSTPFPSRAVTMPPTLQSWLKPVFSPVVQKAALCLTPLWEAAQPAWLPHRWGVISSASS